MTIQISDLLLSSLSELIAGQMGLSFTRERWRDLERGIGSAAREFGFQEAEACARWLLASPLTRGRIEILASHLTVGETYFFRESRSFGIIREHILPELIRARQHDRHLKIWSAGCCTGEEPYSIAILLDQILPDLRDWKISILATDVNPNFLKRASAGVYGNWSFRGGPQPLREKYFKRTEEGRFELLPEIRKMVVFSYLNLAEDADSPLWDATSSMDIIFCRNVLMYFEPERIKTVIHNFYRSLTPGGWFIVSPSELSSTHFLPLVTVAFPTATFYRKERGANAMPDAPGHVETAAAAPPGRLPVASATPAIDALITFSQVLPAVAEPAPLPEAREEKSASPTAYQQAEALYAQGSYDEASARLLDWLSPDRPDHPNHPNHPNHEDAGAMILLARIYANQGRHAEALQWCESAILCNKLSEGAHYLQAVILQERGALKESERSLKRTLYLDPDFTLAHVALGNLALRQGKVRESLRHFENALALLQAYRPEEVLPGSDGLTAGGLAEAIRSTITHRSSK